MANEKAQTPSQNPVPIRREDIQHLIAGMPEGARYVIFRTVDVRIKPGFILRKVGQAYMVMPTGPRMKDYQGMITLNETGAFLFKELEKSDQTRESLTAACKKEYGATDEEAKQAVSMFVQQCTNCGLFETAERIYDVIEDREVTRDELR